MLIVDHKCLPHWGYMEDLFVCCKVLPSQWYGKMSDSLFLPERQKFGYLNCNGIAI